MNHSPFEEAKDQISSLFFCLDHLPEELRDRFARRLMKFINNGILKDFIRHDIRNFLIDDLDLGEKHSDADFKSTVGFAIESDETEHIKDYLMVRDEDDSDSVYSRDYDCAYGEDVLSSWCHGHHRDTSRYMKNLEKVREMGLIERNSELHFHALDMNNKIKCWHREPGEPDSGHNYDTEDLHYNPSEIVPRPNETIFTYLADWDPDALLNIRHASEELWSLQVAMKYCDKGEKKISGHQSGHCTIISHPIETFQMILKAQLKHFPHQLGYLVDKVDDYVGHERDNDIDLSELSAYGYAYQGDAKFGPNKEIHGWTIIEQCLDEANNPKLLQPDPHTNIYPFMLAARDKTCVKLDLLYYLLRKDPAVLVAGLGQGASVEGKSIICKTRKRRR
jgi:hypothetical protein